MLRRQCITTEDVELARRHRIRRRSVRLRDSLALWLTLAFVAIVSGVVAVSIVDMVSRR